MSETHGKVVANIQKQFESAKVWENASSSNPCDKTALKHTKQSMVISGC